MCPVFHGNNESMYTGNTVTKMFKRCGRIVKCADKDKSMVTTRAGCI